MPVRFIAFLFLSLIFFSRPLAQSCTNTFFQKSFQHLNAQSPVQVIPLSSRNVIMGGASSFGFMLTKLTQAGDTLLTKFISSSADNSGVYAQLISDGNNRLMAIYDNRIYSLDTNCNVLSVQKLITNQQQFGQAQIRKIQLMDNGDKIILIRISNACVFVRASPDLSSIKWNKYFTLNKLNAEDFLVDSNRIILGGAYFSDPVFGQAYPFIARFKTDDGSLLQSVVWNPSETANCTVVGIFKTGNQYIANLYMNAASVSNGKYFLLRLDSSLNRISSKRMLPSIQNIARDYNYSFTPDKDGSFFGAGGTSSATPHLLFRINSQDSVNWANPLVLYFVSISDLQQNSDGLLEAGYGNYTNVVTGGNESYFTLAKSDFNGQGLSCLSTTTGALQLTDYVFSKNADQGRSLLQDSAFMFFKDVVRYSHAVINISANCVVNNNNCNQLTLVGNSSICTNAPTVFTGGRNSSCHNKVNWSVTPSATIIANSNNDSTLQVQFLKSGAYKIISTLNADCSTLQDSLVVHVNIAGLNLGNDTALCTGSMVLHAGAQYQQYRWQDGSADSVLTVNRSGTYYVTVKDYCNHSASDTIVIGAGPVYRFPEKLPVKICQGASLPLTSPAGFLSYSWSPDYAINDIHLDKPIVTPAVDTSYIVSMKDSLGCIASDTSRILVQPYPVFRFPSDTLLCDSVILILRATQKDTLARYSWQDGSGLDTFAIRKAGIYRVTVQINGCSLSDSSSIHYLQTPSVHLGNDTVKCVESSLQLNAFFPGAKYLWQDNSTQSSYTVKNGGTFYCILSNDCGTASDTIVVKNQICECTPVIPNVFSPNADGINDEFKPIVNCLPSFYLLQIYDRNGQVLFESSDAGKYWNGTYHGKPVPIGTYYYLLRVRGMSDPIEKRASGSVVVLR